ncbi:MAG: hypothetical protein ACOYMB_00445 [Patescibacteria group bacterium]
MKKYSKILIISFTLFSLMLIGLPVKAATTGFIWTAEAKRMLARVPAGVRPSVKKKAETYAKQHKIKTITLKVMNSFRN